MTDSVVVVVVVIVVVGCRPIRPLPPYEESSSYHRPGPVQVQGVLISDVNDGVRVGGSRARSADESVGQNASRSYLEPLYPHRKSTIENTRKT